MGSVDLQVRECLRETSRPSGGPALRERETQSESEPPGPRPGSVRFRGIPLVPVGPGIRNDPRPDPYHQAVSEGNLTVWRRFLRAEFAVPAGGDGMVPTTTTTNR